MKASSPSSARPTIRRRPRSKGCRGDMARMMDKHENLLSPAAMADFFGEVYWRSAAGLTGA